MRALLDAGADHTKMLNGKSALVYAKTMHMWLLLNAKMGCGMTPLDTAAII